VQIWDVREFRDVGRLEGQGARIWSLVWSPDGQSLVSSSSDGTICLWNPQKTSLLRTIRVCPPGGVIKQVVYFPDGRHVATANTNGTLYVLRLEEWSGGE
jgi:WD40 repeat protein